MKKMTCARACFIWLLAVYSTTVYIPNCVRSSSVHCSPWTRWEPIPARINTLPVESNTHTAVWVVDRAVQGWAMDGAAISVTLAPFHSGGKQNNPRLGCCVQIYPTKGKSDVLKVMQTIGTMIELLLHDFCIIVTWAKGPTCKNPFNSRFSYWFYCKISTWTKNKKHFCFDLIIRYSMPFINGWIPQDYIPEFPLTVSAPICNHLVEGTIPPGSTRSHLWPTDICLNAHQAGFHFK